MATDEPTPDSPSEDTSASTGRSVPESSAEPVVDGRNRDDLFRDATALAPGYTPSWEPGDDAGTALVHLFAELARYATERLDRVPAKQRIAFVERLGFDRAPPQAGRLPLTVAVSDGATENVQIPAGTRAVDDAKTVFETDAGFEATPARLTDVISVDPDADRLYRHGAAVSAGESFQPFTGRDQQAHVLSLGHTSLLQQAPGAAVRVRLRVDADTESETREVADFLADCLVWEWYGEATDPIRLGEPAPEGEPVEDWHVVEPTAIEIDTDRWGEQVVSVELRPPGALTETAVGDRTSRWLRATTNRNCDPESVFELAVGPVTLAVGDRRAVGEGTDTALGGGAVGRSPDALFANDVPLSNPTSEDPIRPFGDHPRHRDSFALSSGDALTTPGATVTLSVTLANADDVSDAGSPSVSWEFWNGDAWTRLPLRDETEPDAQRLTDSGTVVFDVPPDLAETAVAGEDGHWIRARLVGGDYGSVVYERTVDDGGNTETWTTKTDGVTPPTLSMLRIQYGKEERPDHLLAADNGESPRDVSLVLRERTRPFRRLPADGQTLALGFDRRLEDGPIQLLWSPTDRATPADFDPRLAWTYSRRSAGDAEDDGAAGAQWAAPDVADGSERLLTRGLVSVVFPDASDALGLFGADRHWLRASVVAGEFETPPPATGPADLPIRIDRIDAPRETVRLRNTGERGLDLSGYLLDVEHGNQEVDQHRPLPGGTVIDAGGTLTVATGRLSPGPADVWFDFRAPVLNDTVPDEVALLTPAGDPVAVGGGPATDGAEAPDESDETGAAGDAGEAAESDCSCVWHAGSDWGGTGHADPCETTLPTVSSVGDPTETPPVVEVLAVNAGWATNVETVTDEVLGGSDGTADQQFAVASPPVVAESVWVDEARTLSTGDRETLLAERPEGVEIVGEGTAGDTDSQPDAVWVRWTVVEDFLGSGPDDRHYTVDRLSGEIAFGDGRRGRIPPRGRDTVRASYETGGGTAGNVPSETVTKLESAIALVDGVSNPIAGDGGADAESTESAVTRASRTLRDGDRAVTPVDFERVATTTTRKLARARCLPATDAGGERRAGFVTLVIVPASSARKPVPSASLRERVADRVADHAPTTVVTPDRLTVRGPAYVEATVTVSVVATPGVESVSAVERAVDDALSAYLHPLSGGEAGDGWAFGTLPCLADLFAVAEGVAGVDHVADLTVTFHGDGTEARVGDGDEVPGVAEDVLVFAGTHDVRASRASSAGEAGTGGAPTAAGATGTTDADTGGGA